MKAIKRFVAKMCSKDFYNHTLYDDWHLCSLKRKTVESWVRRKKLCERPTDQEIVRQKLNTRHINILVQYFYDYDQERYRICYDEVKLFFKLSGMKLLRELDMLKRSQNCFFIDLKLIVVKRALESVLSHP